MTLRIGIGLFTGQVPRGSDRTFEREYRETLELVRLAESVGFDSAWVSEHHGAGDGYFPSLLTVLAAFAAVTDRIQLGTGLVLAPLHDPIRLAEDTAVVDQLSGGRLIVGLGIGWREEEFRMLRVPLSERAARIEDTVEILRRAWSGERFSFQGKVFELDRVKVTPPAAQSGGPPIVLGGYHERVLIRAGRLADGYICDAAPLDEALGAVRIVDHAAADSGRDPRRLTVALMQNAFVASDADAWAAVRDGVRHQWGAYEVWGGDADTPDDESFDPVVEDEREMRAATLAGTPDQVTEGLRPMIDALADRDLHLIVRLHYPGMDVETAAGAIELFGRTVIPALKRS